MVKLFEKLKIDKSHCQGATLVEFALTFPVVLFVSLLLVDFFLHLLAQATLDRATARAAAYASVVEGLEDTNPDNVEKTIDDIEKKAKDTVTVVLSPSSFLSIQETKYLPPYVNPGNSSALDFRNIPLGVEAHATYKRILPFVPKELSSVAYAYRENRSSSSLPVPLDCLGRKIVPGQALPPIGSCPCPNSDDPLLRLSNTPGQCECASDAAENDQGRCECKVAGQQPDPLTHICKCIVEGQTPVGSYCQCPNPNHEVVNGKCKCKLPYMGNTTSCSCPACPTGSAPISGGDIACGCLCANPNTQFNPDTRKCDCKIDVESCGDEQILDGCVCKDCLGNKVPNQDRTACVCDVSKLNCSDELKDTQNCVCKGYCEFQDSQGNTSTTTGNCVCPVNQLYALCGGPSRSNVQICRCLCVPDETNQKPCGGGCDLAALPAYCKSMGNLPTWPEKCGCKSGVCQGNTTLVTEGPDAGKCVCNPGINKATLIQDCKNQGLLFDGEKCQCSTTSCPTGFINGSGTSCNCSAAQLASYCRSLNLPVGSTSGCTCGQACDSNETVNSNGICECNAAPCPAGAERDMGSNCACKCANNAPIRRCDGTGEDVCVYRAECQNPGAGCECTAQGEFRPPGG